MYLFSKYPLSAPSVPGAKDILARKAHKAALKDVTYQKPDRMRRRVAVKLIKGSSNSGELRAGHEFLNPLIFIFSPHPRSLLQVRKC